MTTAVLGIVGFTDVFFFVQVIIVDAHLNDAAAIGVAIDDICIGNIIAILNLMGFGIAAFFLGIHDTIRFIIPRIHLVVPQFAAAMPIGAGLILATGCIFHAYAISLCGFGTAIGSIGFWIDANAAHRFESAAFDGICWTDVDANAVITEQPFCFAVVVRGTAVFGGIGNAMIVHIGMRAFAAHRFAHAFAFFAVAAACAFFSAPVFAAFVIGVAVASRTTVITA